MRFGVFLLLLLVVLGCSKQPDAYVVGDWMIDMPDYVLNLHFSEKGTYNGNVSTGINMANLTGTYKVEGNHLHLDAPVLSGGTGDVPKIGNLDFTLKKRNPTTYELSSAGKTFLMVNTTPR